MLKTKYSYQKKILMPFDDAVQNVKNALQKEGFGILTEVDVAKTLKNKINVDFDKYVILDACNPPNAYKSLQTEIEVGLLLPCNVIVYENRDEVFVSAILPTVAMSIVDNDELLKIAEDIEDMLINAIDSI